MRPDVPSILPLDTADATLALVGGKGANLARLVRAGLPVPPGFLVATPAYRAFVEANELAPAIAQALAPLDPTDPAALEAASQAIRAAFQVGTLPTDLARALRAAYEAMGEAVPVAVRSSATAEDLPDMSFAGQQDTFLNVRGVRDLLDAVVRCWASLWTARAIGYRARNGIPHEGVALAVVVQQMVSSEASGVLFTANPLTGTRHETVIDATLGLGEALVSGLVEPDHYVVNPRTGHLLSRVLGAKATVTREQAGGGVASVSENNAQRQALPNATIVELAHLGQTVEQLFAAPQDIEWGWAKGKLWLLQSRPITSLYPLPDSPADDELGVYLSFGALQGMLDPITPLGQDTLRGFFTGLARMVGFPTMTLAEQPVLVPAGERLWVNIAGALRHPLGRRFLRAVLPMIDPSIAPALATLWDDPRLTADRPLSPAAGRRLARLLLPMVGHLLAALRAPEQQRHRAQAEIERFIDQWQRRAEAATTLTERLDWYEAMIASLFPFGTRLIPRIMAGVLQMALLHRLATLAEAEGDLALQLTRGLPHNVTTEMDLALWQVAQRLRGDPESDARFTHEEAPALAAAYLAGELPPVAQATLDHFLARYGARGLAEIDAGRPRWQEDPTLVLRTLKSYLAIEDPALAPDTVFARGEAAAEAALAELVAALAARPDGEFLAKLAEWSAHRLRALAGLRESPKFAVIQLLGVGRAALLDGVRPLVEAGILARAEDIAFLHLSELRVRARGAPGDWQGLIARRRARYEREKERRQLPRLFFSDGRAFYEGIMAPAGSEEGAIVGSPVSPGVVEGRVRVILDPHGAQLAPGEILVCPGTDPAWTPLFLAAGGLVMEVGGLMTHGSVVAREYGIPAVVGVHQATERLKTGQRVRVDGSAGRVEILEEEEA